MAQHPRAGSVSALSGGQNTDSKNTSVNVQDGAFVTGFNEIPEQSEAAAFAREGNFAYVPSLGNDVQGVGGDRVMLSGWSSRGRENPVFGGNGRAGIGTASTYANDKADIFYGGSNFFNFGGIYSNLAVFSGATVIGEGSRFIISGAVATGGIDLNGNVVGASVDVFNGATMYNGTAGSGGFMVAGAASGNSDLAGRSLIQDGHILNGGIGIAGGNSSLTVLGGTGVFSDVVVDAGGLVDANGHGTIIGRVIRGTAVVEAGGTISGAVFDGKDAEGYVDGMDSLLPGSLPGGSAVSNIVENGARLSAAGGYLSGNTVLSGGVIDIASGAYLHVAWDCHGHMVINSTDKHLGFLGDPSAVSDVIDNGGTQLVHGGANDDHATVHSGGLLSVYNNGGDTYATIFKGGTMEVGNGGGVIAPIIQAGGTLHAHSGAYISGATIAAGQNKWVGSPGEGAVSNPYGEDGAIVDNGGDFDGGWLAGGHGSGSIVDEMGGVLRVHSGATVEGLHMGDFAEIDLLDFQYNAGESVTYNAKKHRLIFWSDGHSVWGAGLEGKYVGSDFKVWDDNGHPAIVYDKCFLRGTYIATPRGNVAIEYLKEGDTVWAIEAGKKIERPITAVRRETAEINKNLPLDLAGWSVCIKKGAFAGNLPERDLWVTPEHCFYFDGRFLPVRMLVNGLSIYYDLSREHFEFFHIETEPHSILIAEGVLTESWLDTDDNRRRVINLSNGVTQLARMPSRTWEKDAAAPLDVSPVFAEKLWKDFQQLALRNGIKPGESCKPVLNADPALRIRLDDGREIEPLNRRGNQYFFQLPAGVTGASLLSKRFRPCESIGPWIDDRRWLGVLVGKITVAIGDTFRSINMHHHVANLSGWDVVEKIPCRWTNGEGKLPALGSEEELRFGASLIVEILAGGPYPKQEEAQALFKKEM